MKRAGEGRFAAELRHGNRSLPREYTRERNNRGDRESGPQVRHSKSCWKPLNVDLKPDASDEIGLRLGGIPIELAQKRGHVSASFSRK
jgi:hypothetical protein